MESNGSDVGASSIADMLRSAAEEVLTSTVPPGFYFVEDYGQYYSPETGYYYDPNTTLFYHSETKQYFYFDEADGQYKPYGDNSSDKTKNLWTRRAHRRKAAGIYGVETMLSMSQEDVDVCESLFSALDLLENPDERRERRKRQAEEKLVRDEDKKRKKREEMIRQQIYNASRRKTKEVFDGDELIEVPIPDVIGEEEEEETNENADEEDNISVITLSDEEVEPEEDERVRMMRGESRERECEGAGKLAEEGFDQAPCIRLIDEHTNALHVVTLLGGIFGTLPECEIRINDASLPARLAQIIYEGGESASGNSKKNREPGLYLLRVLNKGAKCKLSGDKLRKGEPDMPISHGSVISFTKNNTFNVHIHNGRNTCRGCEPGLLLPSADDPAPLPRVLRGEAARKYNMKMMKNALGLHGREDDTSEDYLDRAKIRRKYIGSESGGTRERRYAAAAGGMYDGCAAKPLPGAVPMATASSSKAAANTSITEENKGFKLLKMMGWKEGGGLGKKADGRVEPVMTEVKNNRAGLGSASFGPSLPQLQMFTQRDSILDKTRERFKQIEESERRKK